MRIIFFMTIPFLLFAQSYGLRTFIDHANEHNPMIQSKERSVQSKAQEVEAAKSDFWPTVDVGAGYTMSTPVTVIAPGQTASASAMIGMDLYDGGRRGAVLNAKSFEHTASLFEKRAFEKSVALNIINTSATGFIDTNYEGKVQAALETLKQHDAGPFRLFSLIQKREVLAVLSRAADDKKRSRNI
jgi:hypothetical protein